MYLNSPKLAKDATTDPVIKRPNVSREKIDCHKRIKVSPNMKLIYPLDFQLRVSASILVDVSLPFAFQRQRVLDLSSMTVFLVLRIKQHVYGMAQLRQLSIKLIKSQVQFSKRQRCILHV